MPDSFNSVQHAIDFLKRRGRVAAIYPVLLPYRPFAMIKVNCRLNDPYEIEAGRYLNRHNHPLIDTLGGYNP